MPCEEVVVMVTVPLTPTAEAIGAMSIQSWKGAVAICYGLVFVRVPFVRFV